MAPHKFKSMLAALVAAGLSVANHPAAVSGPELITTAPAIADTSAHGFTAAAEISPDSRYILFQSSASDISEPPTPQNNINLFLHDRQLGTTTLISRNTNNSGGGNNNSLQAMASADHRFIVFQSYASNLVTNDTDNVADIFLHDRESNITQRLTPRYRQDLQQTIYRRDHSSNPSISADGQRIVFESLASDLLQTIPTNALPMFYLYERSVDKVRIVYGPLGTGSLGVTSIGNTYISKNGNVVYFEAEGQNIITRQLTYGTHLYACDLSAGNHLVAVSSNVMTVLGRPSNTQGNSHLRGVSSNGLINVFITSDVPGISSPGRTNYLFRHQLGDVSPELIATNINQIADAVGPFSDVALSADGEYVTYGIRGNIYRWSATTKARELVTVGLDGSAVTSTNVSQPFMSADGRYVGFVSPATNLIDAELPAGPHLFRRDMVEQTTVGIDTDAAFESGNPTTTDGCISADGRIILFSSGNRNLVNGDLNNGIDSFIWNPEATPKIQLLAKHLPNVSVTKPFRLLSLSSQPMTANGAKVVFSGQLETGTNAFPQIWLRDRAQSTTTLISQDPGDGHAAPAFSQNAMISADGRWIAYETTASNFDNTISDANKTNDVVLFDAQTGVHRHVTKAALEANSPRLGSQLKAMSANGRYLIISSANTNLTETNLVVFGSSTNLALFLWDRDTAKFTPLTLDEFGRATRGEHSSIVFSPDSKHLAFLARGAISYIDARTGMIANAPSISGNTLMIHNLETGVARGYGAGTFAITGVNSFSGDSAFLITAAFRTNNSGAITRINLATGAERAFPVANGRATQVDSAMFGDEIAFISETGAQWPFFSAVGRLDFDIPKTNRLSATGEAIPRKAKITPDGQTIFFQGYTNLVSIDEIADDTNSFADVYVYEIAPEAIAQPLAIGNGATVGHVLSADGSTLLALTQSTTWPYQDLNNSMDLIAFSVTSKPTLAVEITADTLELKWPAAAGVILESSASIDGPPEAWQPVPANPTAEGLLSVQQAPASDAIRFFRLRK